MLDSNCVKTRFYPCFDCLRVGAHSVFSLLQRTGRVDLFQFDCQCKLIFKIRSGTLWVVTHYILRIHIFLSGEDQPIKLRGEIDANHDRYLPNAPFIIRRYFGLVLLHLISWRWGVNSVKSVTVSLIRHCSPNSASNACLSPHSAVFSPSCDRVLIVHAFTIK